MDYIYLQMLYIHEYIIRLLNYYMIIKKMHKTLLLEYIYTYFIHDFHCPFYEDLCSLGQSPEHNRESCCHFVPLCATVFVYL